jgi:site-specific DNA-methyltransferase (adenine-specific)
VKPIYDQDGITLYRGDCRVAPNLLGIEWADLVMADPPYGETSLEWDRWPAQWTGAAACVLKREGAMWCFGSFRMFLDHWSEFGAFKMSHEIVWEKHNGSGFHTDRFRRVHELAVHFSMVDAKWSEVYKSPQFTMDATRRTVRKKEKPAQWHGKRGSTTYVSEDGGPRMMRSVIKARSCHGTAVNETQKPEELVRPLMEYACPKGGTVFVPFVGSGTDLLVARGLGMKAVGFEARAEQCEATMTRLAQGILFGGW